MIEEVFVDGVSAIGMSKGAVRMDLYTVEPGDFDKRVPRQRLILTVEGFRELYQLMGQAMQRMEASSSPLTRQPAKVSGENSGKEPPGAQARPEPVSPNF